MAERLARQDGEWIDRDRPVRFRFEGGEYSGYAGDTLSSALWANGVRVLGRSFKYHRPRGIISMANLDISAMVEPTGRGPHRRTNLRGDVLTIHDGLDVKAVNTFGGVKRDWLRLTGWFWRFMPVGFYYKAFGTPRWLFPFYERRIRSIAGLGRIDRTAPAEATPKCYDFCDLLVVGAGPSGLAAAIAAAEAGVQVTVVDEQPHPGGSLLYQWRNELPAQQQLESLLDRAERLDNLELRTSTVVGGCYDDLWFALFDDKKLTKLRAAAVVFASGAHEQPAVFHSNDLPGVMLGSAAQRLLHLYSVKPFQRGVVLTANSDGYRTALDLHASDVTVAGIIDLRPAGEQSALDHKVADAGIKVYRGYCVYEAHAARPGVRAVTVCPLDDRGEPQTDRPVHIECDGVATCVGWAPASQLPSQAGVAFGYAANVEQFVPDTMPENVFAAGRVNGVFELDGQIADGHRAGQAAAACLGHHDGPVPEPPKHRGPPPSHPYPIVAHPKGKNFVDFDEDLHLADFVNAHQEGYDSIELLKRYTTFGMGPSQGKLANMNAARILARLNGSAMDRMRTPTARPFYHPAPVSQLAGRRFHLLRRTPMHHWHEHASGRFMHAGAWLRPEYYATSDEGRDDLILNEAQHVRQRVGLIDVSTLGKIQISGPDAAAFIERIYTGRFANLAVGRMRYCLACDETGVVIEDGIVARLADDQFYVTATSSGAETFFRDMQRWAILWRMNIVLINATGHLAAMNLAGPEARNVLAELADVDLSPQACGHMAVRQGTVAGAKARIMRVGFVGELGYEIHVPASHGQHVWEAIIAAGAGSDIRPFGVEAQRLLRLEKGHIIVSQDTDALTHPYEADLAWAIGRDKPFFVGQRSLRVLQQQPMTRRLVGFAIDPQYDAPLPDECHLVIDGDDIAGRVTSIAKRSTIGQPVGLAYVKPEQTAPGTTIRIRVGGGSMVTAQVASLPFYDADNARQKM